MLIYCTQRPHQSQTSTSLHLPVHRMHPFLQSQSRSRAPPPNPWLLVSTGYVFMLYIRLFEDFHTERQLLKTLSGPSSKLFRCAKQLVSTKLKSIAKITTSTIPYSFLYFILRSCKPVLHQHQHAILHTISQRQEIRYVSYLPQAAQCKPLAGVVLLQCFH